MISKLTSLIQDNFGRYHTSELAKVEKLDARSRFE
jgi:hypothetical protein